MTRTSDLDLILIYGAPDGALSDGRKSLDVKSYYARFTQALISALSAPMSEGRLYEVDMRLRPSGRQGPVATSLASFESYQMNDAWTWEHLALTRGRVVAGDPDLMTRLETMRQRVLAAKSDPETVADAVRDMRRRLAETKAANRPVWDVKSHVGGLLDIELLAQAKALTGGCPAQNPIDQLTAAEQNGQIDSTDKQVLAAAHRLFVDLQQITRLLSSESIEPHRLGRGAQALLLKVTDAADLATLETRLSDSLSQSETIITREFS